MNRNIYTYFLYFVSSEGGLRRQGIVQEIHDGFQAVLWLGPNESGLVLHDYRSRHSCRDRRRGMGSAAEPERGVKLSHIEFFRCLAD